VRASAVIEGYVGKSKGAKQIAWERGLVEEAVEKQYYYKVLSNEKFHELLLNDVAYKLAHRFNLYLILRQCDDFKNEISQMAYVVEALGGLLVSTPKCHPELAGEGIEYCWGNSKRYYRRSRTQTTIAVNDELFLKMVEDSIRNDGINPPLSLERVRRFARKARMYKLAYYTIANSSEGKAVEEGAAVKAQVHASMQLIESTVKSLKMETYRFAHNAVVANKALEKKRTEERRVLGSTIKLTSTIYVSHRGVELNNVDVL
jgi:hypothetical protein